MTPNLRTAPLALAATLALFPLAPALAQTAPVAATPAPGQPYLVSEHRDWQVICTRLEAEGPEICEMYQLLNETGGQPIAEISIAALAETGDIVAGVTITTPLETFLPTGLGFRIGAEATDMRVEGFRVCTVIGCMVRMGLSADEVAQMQRGTEAFVTFAPFVAVDQPVDIRISLLGFTAALADVRARTPNPPEVSGDMGLTLPVDPSAPPATPPAARE
jgi:invasion protein IalB